MRFSVLIMTAASAWCFGGISARLYPNLEPMKEEQEGKGDLSERIKENLRKEVNFMTNKITKGYLYNVGTKKFIAKAPGNTLMALSAPKARPLPISIFTSFSNSIGTYQEIMSLDSGDYSQYHSRYYGDPYYGSKRFDVYGGLGQKRLGLYITTTTANRMAITPPYYKGESAFKIRISSFCISVDSDNYLVKGQCVDDNNGIPTEENDRQLFVFCNAEKADACMGK